MERGFFVPRPGASLHKKITITQDFFHTKQTG